MKRRIRETKIIAKNFNYRQQWMLLPKKVPNDSGTVITLVVVTTN